MFAPCLFNFFLASGVAEHGRRRQGTRLPVQTPPRAGRALAVQTPLLAGGSSSTVSQAERAAAGVEP
jgi:hypothetical protein